MDVRMFVDRVEAAQRDLRATLGTRPATGLRSELTEELQRLEAGRIAEGQDRHTARAASWKRVKMLHGLGYPVDFGWLHAPVEHAR